MERNSFSSYGPQSPCKDCPNRTVACWDRCKAYQKFKITRTLINRQVQTISQEYNFYFVAADRLRKIQRQKAR